MTPTWTMPTPEPIAVEWLKFRVPQAEQANFIQRDQEIWTTTLAQQQGFIQKSTWIDPAHPDEIVVVVRWQNRGLWKSISPTLLAATEQRFIQALGQTYPLLEQKEYQEALI